MQSVSKNEAEIQAPTCCLSQQWPSLKTPHNPIQVTFRQRLVDFSPDAFGHIHRELKDLKLLQQGWRRWIFWGTYENTH